jgi:response regulator of citrate/malate metabolism
MNILYVEDDPVVSRISKGLFETLDHTVIWCESVICAKTCLSLSKSIDLVLLDMKLIDEHGTDLLKFLESTKSKIPVIIITGRMESYAKEIAHFRERGIVIGVYSKPLNFKGFAADIEALFAHRK